ncbi:TPA: DUF551 domain-containing protein [Klebsiella quasipneumoniae subsp. similipneumoniae]|nr:DUF551 domain-containing protein [Klebsiella quasipneumoniae subsp. similipneumoniae]
MTKSTITRERLQEIAEDGFLKHGESKELARMALAAMDSESECLPLDYLQGHKDGLEWAAKLAESNHHQTGDWLYDDPIELAKAIRKGPDMPPAQPVADSEPVAEVLSNRPGNDTSTIDRALPVGTQLYRHAQPAPVVHGEVASAIEELKRTLVDCNRYNYCSDAIARVESACRAAMLAATQQSPGSEPATAPGKWISVSERILDVGVKVLCFPVEDEPIHAAFNGQLWLQDISWSNSDEPIDNVITCNVTHWMPLPAAPQEVKGE